MADAATTTYSLVKPEVGASEDTWGGKYNTMLDAVDDLLDGTTVVTGIKMDDTLSFVDNADNTKVAQLQLSGITTATTRTFTLPDETGTLLTSSAIGSTVQANIGTITATATELNYVGGVTSAIQTQLDAKLSGSAGSVGTSNIATNAVTLAKMANDSVNTPELVDAAVATAKIEDAAVTTAKINDGAVTAAKLASDAKTTLETAQATTSGTAKDFTGIPAGVNHITVAFDGVSLSGTDDILVQLGDAGGFETTGYDACSAHSAGDSASTSGFNVIRTLAANTASGSMILTRMNGNRWVQQHAMTRNTSGSTASGGGSKTLSAELTQVRITRSGTDTFDAGAVNISYM